MTMARKVTVKCQQCKEKQIYDEETMTIVDRFSDSGRKYRKYFHNKCLNKYNEEQEKTDEELAELDKLVEIAGAIHEAPKPPNMAYQFPRDWYHIIQDFRNGTNRYTRNWKKRFKKGVSYAVLAEAYRLSRDGIKWSRMDKHFKDFSSECRYALAIVSNKIPDAIRKLEKDAHMEKANKAREERELEMMETERETVYQKRKASSDFSELFQ
jgi:hypothetical protein